MFESATIKRIIKKKIIEGNKRFAIYPFGENGLLVKTILYEYFGLSPVCVVDNEYADVNPDIISIHRLVEKYDESLCIILTIENSKINMSMQGELLNFAAKDRIVNLQAEVQQQRIENQYTLLEYIANHSEKYRGKAKLFLNNENEDNGIIRIYSDEEINVIEKICFDCVKELLENEATDIGAMEETEKTILFFAPLFESFWSNILPLFRECMRRGKKCAVMFKSINDFWWTGENLKRILSVIKEIKQEGGECLLYDNSPEPQTKFEKCFFSSEYSTDQPETLKKYCNQLIAVQTTGIYKHIYKNQIKIDQLYRELDSVDYYVGSDYICDWINRNNDAYEKKLLKLGYPKMDTLYHGLNKKGNISEEWKKEMSDRKVILLTMENPEMFLGVFRKYQQVCFVWRPDPEFLDTESCNQKIKKLNEEIKHLIIDHNRSYVDSFNASTAMIGMAIFCVPVNYIFTQKPLLLLDDRLNIYNGRSSMSYQDEAWYKSCFIAKKLEDIDEFIKGVISDDHYCTLGQENYRKEMTRNYDGKVCGRIYDALKINVS